MIQRKDYFKLIGILLPVMAWGVVVQAEDTTISQEIEAGVQQKKVKGDDSKLEEYRDIANGPVLTRYRLSSEGENIDVDVDLKNLRQDDQSADVGVSGSKFKLEGSWDQIRHRTSDQAKTLYTEEANGRLTLPDQIQSVIQSSNTSSANFNKLYGAFATGAHLVDLKTQTNTGAVNFGYNLSDALTMKIDVSQEKKTGHRARGLSFGGTSQMVEVAEPVDYRTYNSKLGMGYQSKDVQWGFNYGFSSFQNLINTLTVDNPVRVTDSATTGASTLRASMAPDNYSHDLSLDGGVNLPLRSRMTAKVALNDMTSVNNLLPYTSNGALHDAFLPVNSNVNDPANLPQSQFKGRMLSWTQNYDLTSKMIHSLDMGLRYHSYQMSNRSDQITFQGDSRYDQTWSSATTLENDRFGYRTDKLSGDLGWRVVDPLNFKLEYGMNWTKREVREVHKQKEGTLGLTGDFTPVKSFLIRASYLNAKRRMQDFNVEDFTGSGETPGLRRYDVSDRDRNQGNLMIQASPGPLTLSLTGGLGHDKYLPGKGDLLGDPALAGAADQMYGLLDTRSGNAGIDIDFQASDRWAFFGFYEYAQETGYQLSNSTNTGVIVQLPSNIWKLRTTDRYNTAGVGVDLSGLMQILDIRMGYNLASSRGSTDILDIGSGLPAGSGNALPETKSTRHDIYLKGKVKATQHLSYTFGYTFEKFDVANWATDNVPLYGGPAATLPPSQTAQKNIYLGNSIGNYRAHIINAGVDYKF